ncbi:tRNA 2-thiouridine(34) synthase MnmA [candidate division WOR-3 bacterium]|nr:tRNA 2-thiouridine(34) synthase MnmA [candidate division WOR-3 bacterium]
MKIVCGMSGGIDSAISVALLLAQGYEVIGITMKLWSAGSCGDAPAPQDSSNKEAQRIATQLGIPHYVVDLSSEFKKEIVDYFVREYSKGRTPNPCVQCNEHIKFEALLKKASELGAELIATGHYAKIESNGKKYVLKRGVDSEKEQSYFLARLSQGVLSKTLLPLGNYTKAQTREMAKEMELITKSESQEVCFIPNNDYTEFLYERIPLKEGDIVDKSGQVLGRHRGIWGYTIGQRKRIPPGGGRDKPFYVTHIDVDENEVVVGDEEDLYSDSLIAGDLNWILDFGEVFEAQVKIRYRHKAAQAHITLQNNGNALVKFKEPQRAITPGQLAVFHQEDIVIGSGWIK